MLITNVEPRECRPGQKIILGEGSSYMSSVDVGHFGNSQGNYSVKIGNKIVQVVSWSMKSIKVIVPELPKGQYKAAVYNGGTRVSREETITVKPALKQMKPMPLKKAKKPKIIKPR